MLGPHVVGQRVVVRRVLRGLTGPTGGPAMTDVLGVCERWGNGSCVVRRENGELIEILVADIVSGKPVPPRPSRFFRFDDEEVERRAAGIFRPREAASCGGWTMRWSGGTNKRASSVLAVGEPDLPLDDVLQVARDFYAARGGRPVAQVVVGSWADRQLVARGWRPIDPHGSGTDVMLAGIAALARQLPAPDDGQLRVHHEDAVSRGWLVGNERALADFEAVAATLRLDDAVFASVCVDGQQVARGRTNLAWDWALFADLTVQPAHRRHGLARIVMADAVRWSAERGATAMLLQVQADNEPAQRLYASLGFERHHSYRYLSAPDAAER